MAWSTLLLAVETVDLPENAPGSWAVAAKRGQTWQGDHHHHPSWVGRQSQQEFTPRDYVRLFAGISARRTVKVAHEEDDSSNHLKYDVTWVDVTGALLDARDVKRARFKEMEYTRSKDVCSNIDRNRPQDKASALLAPLM